MKYAFFARCFGTFHKFAVMSVVDKLDEFCFVLINVFESQILKKSNTFLFPASNYSS